MTKISFLIIATLVSFAAHAGTLEFDSEQTLWACPPGAHYVVMECKVAANHEEKIKIEMASLCVVFSPRQLGIKARDSGLFTNNRIEVHKSVYRYCYRDGH